ncbi:hypothetical protein ABE096_01210 [Robertmurraya massiliosenegalensis]|uniref:hypothetical protein n=1 Tax=Robertmurraya massiliosenegalensis TaxID=1287657 RepID=UPI003D29CC19
MKKLLLENNLQKMMVDDMIILEISYKGVLVLKQLDETKQNDFFQVLYKAFEKGQHDETTLKDLVEELKMNLKSLNDK